MNSLGAKNPGEAGGRDEKQHCEVLLIYEDFASGLRARQAFEQVVDRLEPEVDFDLKLWRFDLLREPSLLEQAVTDAAPADIVFLAARAQGELPPAVKLWFGKWLARKGDNPCALAVSLDLSARDDPAAAQLLQSLHTAARPASVEVLLHLSEAPPTGSELTIEGIHRRAETRTAVLEKSLHRFENHPDRDWGINE